MCCKCHHFLSCSDAVLLMQVYNWPVGPKGLLYDRSWMVVNRNGVCLSQKRESRLCLIQPQVHLSSNRLLLQASGQIMFQQLIEKHTSTCPVLECFFFVFFFLRFPCRPTGMDAISVPLKNTANAHSGYEVCQSKVCGDRCADLCRKLLLEILTHVMWPTSSLSPTHSFTHSIPLLCQHSAALCNCSCVLFTVF